MPTTRTIQVYQFAELDDSAKDKAREWYRSTIDYGWWDSVYEYAERIGIKIDSFDIDRHKIGGKATKDPHEVADKILAEHGETCDTYTLAESFLRERDKAVDTAERNDDGEFVNEWDLDKQLDKIEAEFVRAVLEEYLSILRKEWDYLNSDESVDESILANEYEFDEQGNRI